MNAMVGMRRAMVHGLQVAGDFAREQAAFGFIIVSGVALGIDSAAHEGALAVERKTVAILGSGIDIIYPAQNKMLDEKSVENSNIISEFPMGRKADRITFPIRNRVIAGMCSHIIRVESDCSGGSMITTHIAHEYGRHVMAIPGRVDQRMGRGCHDCEYNKFLRRYTLHREIKR
jgi:DNA processing protein